MILMIAGALLAGIGLIVSPKEFLYAWLVAFMFFLSLGLGALWLVIVHHLFDAGWSVAIRRFCEHISTLLSPWMLFLFLPIAIGAKTIYPWMRENPANDHALAAKLPLFTPLGFYVLATFCFVVWFVLSRRLRYWSLQQDQTGAALPTYRMRFLSGIGIFLFALTLTIAAVMWMKALQHEWFSTMYGVYYFAGSVWVTLATAYVITMILDRQGVLTEVLHEHQYYFLGSLLFAFTVFYAYIHFAQYFIIWNANMPEETIWYVVRERGTWWWVGIVIIFGHFFIPFLALLRIDVKHVFSYMVPLCIWAWLMHFCDVAFNVMPPLLPHGFGEKPIALALVLGCMAVIGGLLAVVWLNFFNSHPPFPQRDPRMLEALGLYHPATTDAAVAKH